MVLALILAAAVVVLPLVALVISLRDELRLVQRRLDRLEREAAERGAGLAAVPPPPAAGVPLPPPLPAPIPAPAPIERGAMEQLVGGVWLQNVGAVLVLLGVFFLILWGYTSGLLGAAVLVVAGVALGLAFAWRGHVLVPRVPGFGQALIGIGLGIVYLSLYLGHFTLRVLDVPVAFTLLGLTSLGTVAVGLRYRTQTIAAIGVFGAFVPELLARVLPLHGFTLTPAGALGWFAVVDLAVFGLAARAGWGRVNLLALGLTTFTWLLSYPGQRWDWGVQIGLCALYLVLGLALLPRLAAPVARPRPSEIAVIALAPLLFLAASSPFLARLDPRASAILLLVMGLAYLLAALWAEPRRSDEDLWRPLTAAATVFLTAALQRAVGSDNAAMAWSLEAAALVWIGLHARGWWIRACGAAVGAVSGALLLARLVGHDGWAPGQPPVFDTGGVRDLVALASLVTVAALLGRSRARSEAELAIARIWTFAVNVLVLTWALRESRHVAASTVAGEQVRMLSAVLTSGAWTVQATLLLGLGWTRGSAFLRWLGLGLLGLTVLKLLVVDLQQVEAFWRFLAAIAVGAALLAVSYAYQRRTRS